MEKKLLMTGSILMLIAVILGAMAAHTLENYLNIDQMNSFQTGVRYQIYHALVMLIISQVNLLSSHSKKVLWILFLAGTILFSFSIYLLSTTAITSLDFRFLGPITPIGGLLLISGWIYGIIKISLFKG
ncbi:DUF423 domain-containing protein [Nonlabens marinus]|uniref:COG2363 n=1 Tax=Nonlabens marinus S1-08 TaxID=1454201 RepID=W8VQL9_9FLAO|nr:DUF423 domain-containing protein [Nonlabens marinus]BAO55150.1 hypothetical protein NMS_1141 [Nonlabens marinus S1-08]